MTTVPHIVVFDLGGVLIDWNPRHLYRRHFAEEAQMERFLAEVVSPAWNHRMDEGRAFGEAIAELVASHPEQAPLIRMYFDRWLEMIGGPLQPTVEVLERLHARGTPLWAITNWSGETFPLVRNDPDYAFLGLFRDIYVSGDLRLAKPGEAIFRHALASMPAAAEACLFIDDAPANVATARRLGMHAHRFTDAATLETDLQRLGLLP